MVCSALMLVYGVYIGTIQTIIEAIGKSLSLGTASLGMIVSAQYVPVAFMPMIMGGVSDRLGRGPVIAAFCAVFGLGLMICGSARTAWVFVLGIVSAGAGFSVCEAVCCAAMSDLGEDWGARGINLSQALLCLGAVFSPLLIRASGLAWRHALYLCAVLCGVVLPIIFRTHFFAARTERTGEKGSIRVLLTAPSFICLLLSILLYIGLESGFGYFIESLIDSRFGRTAISCVSLYWLGMMMSRFLFSSIRYPAKPVLIGGFALSATLFVLLPRTDTAGLSLAMCLATGFAFGPIWSTLLAEATARYPAQAGTASGAMSAGCGAGGIVFPALMGLAAQRFSLIASFSLLCVVAVMGVILCAFLPRR